MPTTRPSCCATVRTISTRCRWSSASPWEKLIRTTLTPAAINGRKVSIESVAGPRVATIFVLRIDSNYQLIVGAIFYHLQLLMMSLLTVCYCSCMPLAHTKALRNPCFFAPALRLPVVSYLQEIQERLHHPSIYS